MVAKAKYMVNFVDELEAYFRNTPKEQFLKEWEETKKYANIGPTVEEFFDDLDFERSIVQPEDAYPKGAYKYVNNRESPYNKGFFFA